MVAGRVLVAGRYRVDRPLAAGGLSRVWLATDESDGSTVAIKRCAVPDGLTAAEGELVRGLILDEARAFARVDHPNVVRIRDVVPEDEPWIVMDYIPSRSLQQVVTESGAMHPRRVAEIGLQMLDGLVAVFRADVLHLDVKPGNVLIADDDRAVLSDFGPAVTDAGVRALTAAGITLGSLNYVAPERLFDGVSTQRADLWSLGATLYFAVEGRRPFRRDTTEETLRALAGRRPDPLQQAGPLTPVITGLMRANPDDRLSASAAGRLLRRVAGSVVLASAKIPPQRSSGAAPPVIAPDTPGATKPAGPPPGRVPAYRRPLPVAAAVVAVAVAGLGVSAGVRDDDASAPPVPATASAVPSASPVFALPPGYVWQRDRKGGFQVAVPRSWRVEKAGGVFTATRPKGGGPVLRVQVWAPPPADPVIGLIGIESATELDTYRRLRIAPTAEPAGAVWEYTYRVGPDRPYRAQDQVLTAGGRTYRITWVCPRGDWSQDLGPWATVLDSFGPLTGA